MGKQLCYASQDMEEAYGGLLCQSCYNESYKMMGRVCVFCPSGGSIGSVVMVMCCFFAILYIVFIVFFCRAGRYWKNTLKNKDSNTFQSAKTTGQDEKALQHQALNRFVGDQMMLENVKGHSTNAKSKQIRNEYQLLHDRFKVMYGWMQCF